MFYSKYSSFYPDQIMIPNYEKICELFLSKVRDDEVKRKMYGIFIAYEFRNV